MDLIKTICDLEHNLDIGDIVVITSATSDRTPAIGNHYKVVKKESKLDKKCFMRAFCDKTDKFNCILLRSVSSNFPLWTCYCTCKLIKKADETEKGDIEWMV